MSITQFSIEEVRCFAERQNFEIRPLTFLVGENSTGKTTALACFQVLTTYWRLGVLDFNSYPYSMGTFKDIARRSRAKEKVFKLGFTTQDDTGYVSGIVEFAQKKGGIEPAVRLVSIKFPGSKSVLIASDESEPNMRLAPSILEQNQYRLNVNPALLSASPPPYLLGNVVPREGGQSEAEKVFLNYFENVGIPWWKIGESLSAFSISPIRSRPKRTYDPTRVFNDPEGSDVPMLLMETKANQKEKWESLKQPLIEFGKRSGMFENIEVKNLAGFMGNPFQLRVKVRGPSSTIIDVGYGVSQILPILVHILDPPISPGYSYTEEGPIVLLQQPEVHLHPRAQAELSSLLALLCRDGRSFVIETHSDYMIDRARIEIRKGTIRPEDVSLIYLEPKGRTVKVHNISFDEMANMIGVPKHYGDFFLKETDKLMGFED